MPLQLDVHIVTAKNAVEAIQQAADTVTAGAQQLTAHDRDEPADRRIEIVQRQRPLPLRRAQLHAGDEAAEVLVAGARRDEDGKRP